MKMKYEFYFLRNLLSNYFILKNANSSNMELTPNNKVPTIIKYLFLKIH